jgi:hypothetical protein
MSMCLFFISHLPRPRNGMRFLWDSHPWLSPEVSQPRNRAPLSAALLRFVLKKEDSQEWLSYRRSMLSN